jgi:hypothetical protein
LLIYKKVELTQKAYKRKETMSTIEMAQRPRDLDPEPPADHIARQMLETVDNHTGRTITNHIVSPDGPVEVPATGIALVAEQPVAPEAAASSGVAGWTAFRKPPSVPHYGAYEQHPGYTLASVKFRPDGDSATQPAKAAKLADEYFVEPADISGELRVTKTASSKLKRGLGRAALPVAKIVSPRRRSHTEFRVKTKHSEQQRVLDLMRSSEEEL